MERTRLLGAITVLAIATLGLTGCAADPTGDKAGGEAAPVRLRVGTPDPPGRPGADQIEEFGRRVEEGSGGSLRIDPVWLAAGDFDVDDWDQVVARQVVSGELDLALIPARAWDTEGVSSLRALHAPLLVTSDALVADIIGGDLGDELLAGLEEARVTGLALLPEGLRRLFAFGDEALSFDGLDGKVIRAPYSDTTYALFEALGAVPDDLVGPEAIAAGSVAAAETSFAGATNMGAPTTAIGNVTLFPKVNTLVVNSAAFDALTDDQQNDLRTAARTTMGWAMSQGDLDIDAARQYCAAGGRITHIDHSEVERLEQAVAPVYAELEQDPSTRDIIAQIRALKEQAPEPAEPAPCDGRGDSRASAEIDAGTDDPSVLNGIYRYEVTYEYLRDQGLSEEQSRQESGVHTVTMRDGEFTDSWSNPLVTESCIGTYSVNGNRFTIRWTSRCTGDVSMTYTIDGDQLLLSDPEMLPPHDSPQDQQIAEAFAVPWTRIADAPPLQTGD